MIAIAAMSRNRVIGKGDAIPWRIPEEHRWFRRTTMGGVLVMGRRTFQGLPRLLDGRVSAVLTHDPARLLAEAAQRGPLAGAAVEPAAGAPGAPGALPGVSALRLPAVPGTEVWLASDLAALIRGAGPRQVWLCGGAQLYAQFLPACEQLYLTVVDRDVDGDAWFPAFEPLFAEDGVLHEGEEFRVVRWRRRELAPGAPPARG